MNFEKNENNISLAAGSFIYQKLKWKSAFSFISLEMKEPSSFDVACSNLGSK